MNGDDLEPIDLSNAPGTGRVVARKRFGVSRRPAALGIVGVVVVAAAVGVGVLSQSGPKSRAAVVPTLTSSTAPFVVAPTAVPQTSGGNIAHVTRLAIPAADMISAFGSIWVSQLNRVARLDPVTGRVTATIPVPGTSDFRSLAAGGGALWVDDSGTETLTRIDPGRNTVAASIPMRDRVFVTDGLAFFDGKLWIARPVPAGRRGQLVAIDPATNRIVPQTSVPRTFNVVAGSTALWYVDGMDLRRFDTRFLHTTVMRHGVRAVLAAADEHLWLLTSYGVIEIDERTGAQLGPAIPVGPVNPTAAVGAGVCWLGSQPDSSNPAAVTPYDAVNHRALAAPITVGLPIIAMTVLDKAVWVDAGTLTRIPFPQSNR